MREDSYFHYWICDFGHFHEVLISKNDFFSATYVKIQRNEENVGGAYRRHEGEGDEMHASAEVRRFKSLHTQIESCLSILHAHCTAQYGNTGCGVFKRGVQN